MSDLNVKISSAARAKPHPDKGKMPILFSYAPSDDGTDENLLILLHGLGDTQVPFYKLGQSLKLPQTAVLSLCAPQQIPFLHEDSFQWYPSFDNLGELIQSPNPSSALEVLQEVVLHLVDQCEWSAKNIHLFGFGQGGTVSAEFGLHWWKLRRQLDGIALGSVVSIAGPLISYPTSTILTPSPILVVHRIGHPEFTIPKGALAAFKKGYEVVREVNIGIGQMGMPASKEEWLPIMTFWSERLAKRQAEGLYEVMTGQSYPK